MSQMEPTRKRTTNRRCDDFTEFLSAEAITAGATLRYTSRWYVLRFRSRVFTMPDDTQPSVQQIRNLADTIVYIKRPALYDRAYILSIADDIPDEVKETKKA